MVEIRKCTFRDIKDNSALVAEYTNCALEGLPNPVVQWDSYAVLELNGALHVLGAYCDDVLIGFVSTLSHVSLHYGKPITVTESFYVMQAHRKSGAGIKLLAEVERHARSVGSAGVMITAPNGEALDAVLAAKSYVVSHKVYFKGINNE